MGIIVTITGPRGVGKSTTIEIIKKNYPNIYIKEGFIKNYLPDDTPELFLLKEKKYILEYIELLKKIRNENYIALLTRGPEEIIVYIKTVLKINHPDWNVIHYLEEDFKKLEKFFSDKIYFLDCCDDELKKRWINDDKNRENFEFWITYRKIANEFYCNLNNYSYIDASKTSPNERAAIIEEYLKGMC